MKVERLVREREKERERLPKTIFCCSVKISLLVKKFNLKWGYKEFSLAKVRGRVLEGRSKRKKREEKKKKTTLI